MSTLRKPPGFTTQHLGWIFGVSAVAVVVLLSSQQFKLDSTSRDLELCEQQQTQPLVYKEVCDHMPPGPVPPSFRMECDSKCAPRVSAIEYNKSYGWKCLCDPDMGC